MKWQRPKASRVRKKKSWEDTRNDTAAMWRALLRSEDVQDLINQAPRDANYFRRNKQFPKQETTTK